MDITIVGAGIVGVSIAYELAARGARVRVLDPRGIGNGATQASAGILAPDIEAHGSRFLELLSCSLGMFREFVARVEADSGCQVELDLGGSLQVAQTGPEAAHLTAAARLMADGGVPHQVLDAAAARRLEPELADGTILALLAPRHGYVAVTPFVEAISQAAAKHGATFSTTRALGVVPGPGGIEVHTSDGAVVSDAVVLAAGSWFGQLQTGASHVVKPIRGQLVRLRAQRRPASRVIWGAGCYLVPWRDGAVLAGATVEDAGFDETATTAGVRDLLAAATALLPSLATARFEGVRVGLRPMIADELPAIGRSSTNAALFYAIGHYRNGVLLSPLTARLVADLVLEGREGPELALVRPDRLGL